MYLYQQIYLYIYILSTYLCAYALSVSPFAAMPPVATILKTRSPRCRLDIPSLVHLQHSLLGKSRMSSLRIDSNWSLTEGKLSYLLVDPSILI